MFDQSEFLDAVRGDLSQLPTERLEAEMMSLAGHLAAAMCQFLLLVAEFDRREGWTSWECLSTAHWLNWRCGVGMTAAREQVRVADRLVKLPVVREEFAAGRLSYSKVRAITRVASGETESGLVRMAQAATAAQMERACRALRRTQDLAAAEAELHDKETSAHERRAMSWRHDDGEVDFRLRLSTEAAEVLIRAIAAATEPSDHDIPEGHGLDQRRADALVEIAAAHLGGPDAGGAGATSEIVVHVDATAAAELARREECRDGFGAPSSGAKASSATPDLHPADGAATATDSDTNVETPAAADHFDHDEPVHWPVTTSAGAPLSFAALERLACDCGRRMVIRLPTGVS